MFSSDDIAFKHKLIVVATVATGSAVLLTSAFIAVYRRLLLGAPLFEASLAWLVVLLVTASACLIAYALSHRFLRAISKPLAQLTQAASRVAASQDFSVRVAVQGVSELDRLIIAFNDMLAQMQQRDIALRNAQSNLEQRVEERTHELAHSLALLNATLEATTDGIVATQFAGKSICYNSRYRAMWGIPEDMMHEATATQRIAWTATQVVDPRQYQRRLAELRAESQIAAFDIIELKDGRVFERHCRPQVIDGKTVGRVVSFRDITASRQAQQELEQIHAQLQQASRQAGMTEVATNMLHNVGNVLNSVNVSATLLVENIGKSRLDGLVKAAAQLVEHAENLDGYLHGDTRGRMLPDYLVQLAAHLMAERQANLKELEFLRQNVEHIREIVSMQQTYARGPTFKESFDVTALLETSLRINLASSKRQHMQFERHFDPVPRVEADRHKVLQILVNLMKNAMRACEDAGHTEPRVRLGVSFVNDRVRITVADNGVGIEAEHLTRIFNYGFTTRRDGHGFGLHSGALAAKELGGTLRAHSDGKGKGAEFVLELPAGVTK